VLRKRRQRDLIRLTNPRGSVTSYGYDAYGNRSTVTDAVGNTLTNVFDERGRLLETRDTFGHHIRHAYDGLDRESRNRAWTTLAREARTSNGSPVQDQRSDRKPPRRPRSRDRYAYDAIDRLVSKREEAVLQADGSTVVLHRSYAYDAEGTSRTRRTRAALSAHIATMR